ncbi:MAG TPA: hypothetical protein VFZ77_00250 [Acidimicrobiales bacterium]
MSAGGTHAVVEGHLPATPQEAAVSTPPPAPTGRARRWLVVGGLVAAVGVPLIVAAVAVRRPHWYPVLDLAMTELRLRDVGTRHTPLIGLPGRIGPSIPEQGSHPGPLSFYLLASLYRMLGSTAWAMQAGTAVLNLAAIGAAVAVAARRGGTRLALAVAALVAVLVAGYGVAALVEPWNPYLPLMWWVVFLLAAWSVACGDAAVLPVAVFAGSLCAQTHVPYVGLVAGVGVVAGAAAVVAWRQAGPDSDLRRSTARWGAAALVLAAVLWAPPLVDQATNDPGNLRRIYDHLATPTEEPVGWGRGVELTLVHLDVTQFVGGSAAASGSLVDPASDPDGSIVPGLVLLIAWAAAFMAAARLRHRALVLLHVVVAGGLLAGVVSMSRIFGKVWPYLLQWAWGVAGLLVLAVAWTALTAARTRLGPVGGRRLAAGCVGALAAVTVVASASTTVDAVGIDPPASDLSAALAGVLPPTVAALERGDGAASGPDGRYLVAWSDALYFGSPGFGVVSELERAGFDAGAAPVWHVPITDHRVLHPDDATAVVHLATGMFIERMRDVPGTREVAYFEPRSPREIAEFARLRSAVVEDLRADGLDELVPAVDGNVFGVSIDPRVSADVRRWTARMLDIGLPTAVFIEPPGATP